MVFEKVIKFLALIVVVCVIYFRKYYGFIVVVGIIFLAYKFGLHKKVYKVVNKISGTTKKVKMDQNKKKKYLKKFFKYKTRKKLFVFQTSEIL